MSGSENTYNLVTSLMDDDPLVLQSFINSETTIKVKEHPANGIILYFYFLSQGCENLRQKSSEVFESFQIM